uniref:Uncharacterized protein n=1 Tax=Rhizophora mucronata TaxID=61149 RepID=A0A2P2N226_RHIMU
MDEAELLELIEV